MLADEPDNSSQVGALSRNIQKPGTFRVEVVEFIANELPIWRDRADRPSVMEETALTSQLCRHLNGVKRHKPAIDSLQFLTEEPDEQRRDRKIDLVPAPSGQEIWIEGRRHTEFDSIMPIECKRLPTPVDGDRDEREYVIHRKKTTGGIQRFKKGYHGSTHKFGAMIGYVQKETVQVWERRVASWINDLAIAKLSNWTVKDLLQYIRMDSTLKLALLHSVHERKNSLPDIELRHLWIEMAEP